MEFPVLSGSARQKLLTPLPGKIRAVIDSDTFNEVDDQFAIAYALCSPERLQVEAIYAAPFTSMPEVGMVPEATGPDIGMELSYKEILHVLELMGEEADGRVFRGSASYLPGPYEPVDSEAARDLAARAMQSEELLYVLAIGAITNVASAILMEPRIIERIVVVWLGGQPYHFPYAAEFNLMQDIYASQLILDCGVPLVHIPCMGVASHLTTTPAELNRFLRGSAVGSYLADIVCANCKEPADPVPEMNPFRNMYMNDCPDDVSDAFVTRSIAGSRIIWDISAVAYAINPNWCPSTLVPSPILTSDMTWRQDHNRHFIRRCNYVQRDAIFGDLFSKLDKLSGINKP